MTHLQALLSPHRPHGRQGIALIVAMFVLFAISGLGLVAMQTASIEIRVTGNYRLDKQAHFVTESGLMTAMALVAQSGDGFWTLMKRAAQADGTSSPEMTLTEADFATTLFIEPAADTATLNPRFSVRIHDPIDGMRAPGYSEDFCFKRLTFDATGFVGDDPTTVNVDDQYFRASSRSFRAEALMGPLECEGN